MFWGFYWIMTGIHAVHLTGGILIVLVVFALFKRRIIPVQGSTMEGVAIYWHFVDSVWLVLYPLLYGACNVLLLPGGVLAIGSGLFFGIWWGFTLNLIGNVGGAAVSFFISRKLGRGWVARSWAVKLWRGTSGIQLPTREGWAENWVTSAWAY